MKFFAFSCDKFVVLSLWKRFLQFYSVLITFDRIFFNFIRFWKYTFFAFDFFFAKILDSGIRVKAIPEVGYPGSNYITRAHPYLIA